MKRYEYKANTTLFIVQAITVTILLISYPFIRFFDNLDIIFDRCPWYFLFCFITVFIVLVIVILNFKKRKIFYVEITGDQIRLNTGEMFSYEEIIDVEIDLTNYKKKEIERTTVKYKQGNIEGKFNFKEDLIGYKELSNELLRVAKGNREKIKAR